MQVSGAVRQKDNGNEEQVWAEKAKEEMDRKGEVTVELP